MIRASIIFLFLGFCANAQISEPKLIFKEQDPIINETLAQLVDIQTDGYFEDKVLYSAWSSNGVIYFSEAIRAQVFSFTKLRFKHQEYFAFKKLTLDSVQNDSILTLFQTISAYPASRYIKNWSKTVDGKLYQVEIFNKKVDYQLKTYSGIPSNFESCPEAKNLDLFFKFVERIILTTNKEDLSIIYDQFYVDYETGRFVPQLSKGEFKALKENSNLILKKAASNKR